MDAIANAVFFGVLAVAALGLVAWGIDGIWRKMPSRARVAQWLDVHATPDWRLAHRLRSVQLSVFWAVVGGLWAALPAFQSFLPPIWFAALCVGFSLAILFARFTGQKGLPDA